MSDFKWWQDAENAGDVILPEQRALAIYPNGKGNIVLRQEAGWNDDEDAVILVCPQHAERVAHALLNCAREVRGQQQPEEVEGAPEVNARPPTANALRQRRFKEKRRHAVTRVTPGNAETPPLAPDVAELFEEEEEHQLSRARHA